MNGDGTGGGGGDCSGYDGCCIFGERVTLVSGRFGGDGNDGR